MEQTEDLLYNWYINTSTIFPWRKSRNPYQIWISEIMLQQTQVSTVIPFYLKWIDKYPGINDLQNVPLDNLLKLWEGLGYYRRVINIYNAHKQIIKYYNNKIPDTYDALMNLPGIGDYTACAILSIAYNKPYASIDANIKRVISRLYTLQPSKQKVLIYKSYVQNYYLKYKPGIMNQSLMDLGREICTAKKPKCTECPLNITCLAYKKNTVFLFPVKTKKKNIPLYNVVVGIIYKKNHFLISKRKKNGMLANLWELPGGKIEKNESSIECLTREIKEETDLNVEVKQYIGNIDHQYSHFKIKVKLYKCQYISGEAKPLSSQQVKWINKKNINKFTFPTATHKLFKLLKD